MIRSRTGVRTSVAVPAFLIAASIGAASCARPKSGAESTTVAVAEAVPSPPPASPSSIPSPSPPNDDDAGAPRPFAAAPSNGVPTDRALGCLALDQVDNTMSPPELLSSLFECAGQKRFMDAAMLSGISGAFAAFDALRVADENGRQMGTILRGQLAALTAEAKTALSDEVTRVQSDKSLHRQLCERVREIGAPTYAPKYMTESALAHPTASPDGLVPGFNASAAWGGVASSYLGCSLR